MLQVMKKLLTVAIILAIIFTQTACADNSDLSTRSWTNVSYSSASSTCNLDVFLPATGEGPFPVVIWIHGGAFMMGTKDNPQSKTALNNAGFAVVSINYRLSREAKWPAQLNDLKECVKFLRTNASTYALDPNKFASFGASAGGHLASMMGAALASDPATRVQATVEWFGPLHFYYMDEDMLASEFLLSGGSRATGANGDSTSPESVLLGVTVKENLAACYAASPISFIDTMNVNTPFPAFLCMHGNKDPNIAPKQSVRLHNAIQARFGTAKSQYILLPSGTHGGGDFTLASTETTVINFLKAQLMNSTAVANVSAPEKTKLTYNAANKVLTVNLTENKSNITNYQLFNSSGLKVKEGNITELSINVSQLKGIYIFKSLSGNQLVDVQKISIL